MELHDIAAEATVLAAAMEQPQLLPLMNDLPNETFYKIGHRLIHRAIVDLYRAKEPTDHSTVARRAAVAAETSPASQEVNRAVMGMIGRGAGVSVGFYIDRLRGLHIARQVHDAGGRLQSMVQEAVRLDELEILDVGVETAQNELSALKFENNPTAEDLPISLSELLDKKFEHDWLIPELLERTDRAIFTGFEGTGKSFLLAQFAVTIAAGLHPFLGIPMNDGKQVLVIDAENSERQTGRRYRGIRDMVQRLIDDLHHTQPDWGKQVRFVIRPEGIPLDDPREVRRIERAIAITNPDLVIIGPLYRLHKLDTKDEQAAKELTDTLDRLRVKHQFCMIAEAHVPHGTAGQNRALRPVGSSLFLRWPEFGFGLRPAVGTEQQEHPDTVEMATWRGGREERMWPAKLQHSPRLPWGPTDEYYTKAAEMGWI